MAYKILIVDDDKSLSYIMGETLKRHGYEVMLAYSEEECYQIHSQYFSCFNCYCRINYLDNLG